MAPTTPKPLAAASRQIHPDSHAACAATRNAQIAQGVAPWQKPWQPGPHVPVAALHTTRPSTPRQRRS